MTRKAYFLNGEEVAKPKVIYINGNVCYSPSDEQIVAAGWTIEEEIVPEPTEEDKARQEMQNRIYELKGLLQDSDYKAIKFAEGELSAEEYETTRLERRAWRLEINAIESELAEEGES